MAYSNGELMAPEDVAILASDPIMCATNLEVSFRLGMIRCVINFSVFLTVREDTWVPIMSKQCSSTQIDIQNPCDFDTNPPLICLHKQCGIDVAYCKTHIFLRCLFASTVSCEII